MEGSQNLLDSGKVQPCRNLLVQGISRRSVSVLESQRESMDPIPKPLPSIAPNPTEGWQDSPRLLIVLLILIITLVYSNSLHGDFIYDDIYDILDNPSIQKLMPLKELFMANWNGKLTLLSRPVVNLSFAISYAMGGFKPFYFHLFNLLIHVFAGMALFGIVRRALSLPKMKLIYGDNIPLLAILIAILWAIHPLQTESVTYMTQRFESLMGCFSLVCVYCAIRAGDSSHPGRWAFLSALSCFLALGSKEVAVSIPILILLFDRAFMAGSFKEAWHRRRLLYLGLLLAWGCFGWIQLQAQGRAPWAGFGLEMPWWRYALSQPGVILHYLRLVAWPDPLCIDYMWLPAKTLNRVLPGALVIGGLLLGTGYSLIRKPGLGFLGASFFLILAPTSSIMPLADLAVEHRMYLPLAPVIAGLVLGSYHLARVLHDRNWMPWPIARFVIIALVAMTLASLGGLTYLRNTDYRSALNIWGDTVQKVPNNPRAHLNYGSALKKEGYIDDAIKEYKKAIELAPRIPMGYTNLGAIYGERGEIDESLNYLNKAIILSPENPQYLSNLGLVLLKIQLYDNSLSYFEKAVQVSPEYAPGYANIGEVFFQKKDYGKSILNFKKAIEINPRAFKYHWGLAVSLLESGNEVAASAAFGEALRLAERPVGWTSLLGWIYWQHKKDALAIPPLRAALRMKPDDVQSMIRLSWILSTSPDARLRDGTEALKWAEAALSSSGTRSPEILDPLAAALAELGRYLEAAAVIQEAIEKSRQAEEGPIKELRGRLIFYKNKKPFRDTSRSNASQASSSYRRLSPEIM